MTAPAPHPIALPDHWTPTQALAAFELIDLLRDQLWRVYGPDIQRAMREDQLSNEQKLPDTDPPF
ncbi:MAG TPA: hypothetical protein VN754_07575 [Candidatus Binataceae bacterium]|nr:hypothetical protein [Candidatus Binataceae bacterium]